MSRINVREVAETNADTPKNLPRGVAAAWANLNGTGTIALRDSENVSSVTDLGTGYYAFDLINVMANADYALVGSGIREAGTYVSSYTHGCRPETTGQCRYASTFGETGSAEDSLYSCVEFLGDLA